MRPEGRPVRCFQSPAAVGLVLLLVTLTGCSRLNFVQPDPRRGDFDRTAPEVTLRPQSVDVMSLLQRGQQALLAGELDEAEEAGRKASRIDRQSAQAQSLLAMVADRRGQTSKAGQFYRRALEMAPNTGVMLNNYAAWLCAAGRTAEALPLFERAANAPGYPTPAAALANAGVCAGRAGMADRSEQLLRQALALDPVNVLALDAMAAREFGAGRYFEARAFSERRLAAARADRQALQLASQIEQKLGDNVAAAKYVQRIKVEFPDAANSVSGDGNRR